MLKQMAFPVNVVSVYDRTVRCHRRLVLVRPDQCADQFFAASAMGDSMDSVLLPELLGETWVAAPYIDKVTGDLPPAGSEQDLITSSLVDKTLTVVREWVLAGSPPSWSDCAGLSPELRSWHLQLGNLSIDSEVVCGVAGHRRQWHCS